jgi:hypothetical protein
MFNFHTLYIDFQLRMIIKQSENVTDEQMRQVIDEENRPLLKRLVKRKLKDRNMSKFGMFPGPLSHWISSGSGGEATILHCW